MKLPENKNLYWLTAVLVAVAAVGVLISVGIGSPGEAKQVQLAQSSQPGGAVDRAGIRGIIEYTVRDSNGKVKDHAVIQNAVHDEGKNDTFNLITGNSGNGGYSRIAALSVDVATDNPATGGVAASSITLLLDGNSGAGGNQNPAQGVVATDFGGSGPGNGTVAVTFTATGAADVKQIVLTRAAEDDTTVGGASAIDSNQIFAYVDVPDISLASGDSVTYTWTINVD